MDDGRRMYYTNLKNLSRAPAHVRSDYLRIARWVVAEVPRRWVARLSVPVLLLTLGACDGADIDAKRTDVYEMARGNGYPDEFHRWVRSAVRSQLHETGARCVALVCHSGMSSPFQGPLLRTLMRLPDEDAHLHAAHRDDEWPFWETFSYRRGPLRRLRFAPEVNQRLADAQRED